jgi:hypothetical protein
LVGKVLCGYCNSLPLSKESPRDFVGFWLSGSGPSSNRSTRLLMYVRARNGMPGKRTLSGWQLRWLDIK